ncbi:MAG TPA: hypothetical protein VIL36_07880 [Acidimicrobiales bacterium]
MPSPEPVLLDLGDFDAVGIAADVVDTVRRHAIESGADVAATVSAPEGWHRVVVTGRRSGHAVLGVRFTELTRSRRHNVERAIAEQGWDVDDDGDGATRRYPPGTPASEVAFDLLGAVTLAGAPTGAARRITAVDASGAPVALT